MAPADTTPSIFDWLKMWWELLLGIALIAAGAVRSAFFLGGQARKLRAVADTVDKIQNIIPNEALEKGFMLQTVNNCNDRRATCGIDKVVHELSSDIKRLIRLQETSRVKYTEAIIMLINRLPDLDADAREEISKKLV